MYTISAYLFFIKRQLQLGLHKNLYFHGIFKQRGAKAIVLYFISYSNYHFCSPQEFRCMYVVLLMTAYWVTEALPLPITSMIPLVLFPVLGILVNSMAFSHESRRVINNFAKFRTPKRHQCYT